MPAGQFIISAVVINNTIALSILSQLGALAGEATLAITIPVVSTLGFPVGGCDVVVTGLASAAQRPIRTPSWCS